MVETLMAAESFDPSPLTAWFAMIATFLAAAGGIVAAVKKINDNFEDRVTALVREVTIPIQPGSNGGESLSDLHAKIDDLDGRYTSIFKSVTDERHDWHKRYLDDRELTKKERAAIFIAIRSMIHKNQSEQIALWDDIVDAVADGTIIEKYPDRREPNDLY